MKGRPVLALARFRTSPPPLRLPSRPRVLAAGLLLSALGFGGCAQSPQQIAASSHGKEYFPSSVYGRASRRVIADGQPIPRGGGQYLVGKPYTVAGQTYVPSERHIVQVGLASWYGDAFHGRLTANGEIYDRDSFTAAHPTMPLPSYARVTNLSNHYSMIVRVNDRGPYAANRIMDVSRRVAEALDFQRNGTAKVKVEYVGAASLAGSDDTRLYATLRQDGPARWHGEEPTMVAERHTPAPALASLSSDRPERAVRRSADLDPETTGLPRHDVLTRDVETLARLESSNRRRGETASDEEGPRSERSARREDGRRRDARHEDPRHEDARREDSRREPRAEHLAIAEMRHPPLPPARFARAAVVPVVLPPSRPAEIGRLRGAASGTRHGAALRMARARDD